MQKSTSIQKYDRALSRTIQVVFTLLLGAAIAITGIVTQEAQAANDRGLATATDTTRKAVTDYLSSHENDTYYLTTPYPTLGNTYDYNIYPNGAPRSDGYIGLNCGGFVLHVFRSIGADISGIEAWNDGDMGATSVGAWRGWCTNNNIEMNSYASIPDLLASGKAAKGDLVVFIPTDWGVPGADSHIGFFWGNTSSENKFWHSDSKGNRISSLSGKTSSNTIYLISLEDSGGIDILKESSNKDISDRNACYSLEGAEYGVWSNKNLSDASKVGTLKLDANGAAKLEELDAGTYYVKETKPGEGFRLDAATYPVEVSGGKITRVNATKGGIVFDEPGNDPIGALVAKVDADTGKLVAQGNASLAEAQFTVEYYDGYYNSADDARASGKAKRTWVFKTNNNGIILLNKEYYVSGDALYNNQLGIATLPYGTYLYYETKPPSGYLLPSNPSVFVSRIIYDRTLPNGEKPDFSPYTKVEGDRFPTVGNEANSSTKQSEQVIKGGVKIQKLDDLINADGGTQGEASLSGINFEIVSKNTHPVSIDGVEHATDKVVKTITTDAGGYASTAADTLPFGTYQIRESATNTSYLNTSTPLTFSIQKNGEIVDLTKAASKGFYDSVVRGGVKIGKFDSELSSEDVHSALGSGTLEGTVIEITSENPKPVQVEGVLYTKGQPVKTITTDASGIATTEADTLPFGTYSAREITAPLGYLDTNTVITFSIRDNGKIVDLSGRTKGFKNLIKRGDLAGNKIESSSNTRMAGIPFAIHSQTTGERHIIVTDENGYFSTAAQWNLHTHHTNANDNAVQWSEDGSYVIDESKLDDTAGIWFGRAQDASDTALANDELGALPFDTYTITELSCSANEHKALISFEIVISRNNVAVDAGTLTNEIVNSISLMKVDTSTGDALSGVSLQLVRSADKEIIWEGTSNESEIIINDVAAGAYELIETIQVDGYVKSEALAFTVSPAVPITFVEMENDYTRVSIVKRDAHTGDVLAGARFRIENEAAETVYEWESSAEPYQIIGIKQGSYTLIEDEAPTTHKTAAYRENFIVDENGLIAGESSFELVVENEKIEIGTTALDAESGTAHLTAREKSIVQDTVTYKGLRKGTEYKLEATLMDKAAGTALLDADGNEIKQEQFFTPAHADGNIVVEIEFDASLLSGSTIVVFETLYLDETPVAIHADINDSGQTIFIETPGIGTRANDAKTLSKNLLADSEASIVDTIEYWMLEVGTEYTIIGFLMDKATGHAITDAEGKAITSSISFIPEKSEGTIEVVFPFDANMHAGKTLVVFEELTKSEDSTLIAEHKDINSTDQSIHVIAPHVDTAAYEKTSKAKEIIPLANMIVVDELYYENLVVGTEYTTIATLMDKETGKAAQVQGKEITATASFTPEKGAGTTHVELAFDANALADKTLVVFEEVYEGSGEERKLVLEHKDINNKEQTVQVVEAITSPISENTAPKTGDTALFGGMLALALSMFSLVIVAKVKRRKEQRRFRKIHLHS